MNSVNAYASKKTQQTFKKTITSLSKFKQIKSIPSIYKSNLHFIKRIFILCILSFSSPAFAQNAISSDENSVESYSSELFDESENRNSDMQIEIVESNDDLLMWVDTLVSLDELGEGASEFETQLYNFLVEYQQREKVWLVKPRARRRSCSALNSSSARNGMASWYGPGFHGNRTANGERFNQNELTAAHKTIPFNSIVEVSYKGRTVRVRINDAGPYHGNRIIDLSKEAADQLGLIDAGAGKVKLTLVACSEA